MNAIGKYHIFAEIHQGALTTLYKAFHPELERIVFIKKLNPDRCQDEELLERFQQEGLVAAKINHPNVISIFDYGVFQNTPFLVMEFIEGISLAEILQKYGSLPVDIAIFIMSKMCAGIHALHQKNFIHRDIKPANILISNEGEVKIGDFGFAENALDAERLILGTPAYMSPEVVLAQKIDERSDIFSMGIVLYEMLSGSNPFMASKTSLILKKIVNFNPPMIDKIRGSMILEMCQKMLEKEPQQRISSLKPVMQQLAPYVQPLDENSLQNFLANPDQHIDIRFEPVIDAPGTPAQVKKNRRSFAYIAATALAFIIIFLIYFNVSRWEIPDVPLNNLAVFQKAREDTIPQVPSGQGQPVKENAVQPVAAKKTDIFPTLATAPEQLSPITIVADPRSWIIIDDDTLGISPVRYEISAMPVTLRLKIKNPGFPLITKSLTITDVKQCQISISLWKEVSYLNLTVNPWGEIWIDGDSVDVTPLSHPILLAPGRHNIEIRHPTLEDVQEKFVLFAGDTLDKIYSLINAP